MLKYKYSLGFRALCLVVIEIFIFLQLAYTPLSEARTDNRDYFSYLDEISRLVRTGGPEVVLPDHVVQKDLDTLLSELSGGLFPLGEVDLERDVEGELTGVAENYAQIISQDFGWEELSAEEQAVLKTMAENLIEYAITLDVKYGEGEGRRALTEAVANIDIILKEIGKLVGKSSLSLTDKLDVTFITPWMIVAMETFLRNKLSMEDAMGEVKEIIDDVVREGTTRPIDYTNPTEVGMLAAEVKLKMLESKLPSGWEGLLAIVSQWSMVYNLPEQTMLDYVNEAVSNIGIIDSGLKKLGISINTDTRLPWIGVSIDRAIRENISVSQALRDINTMVDFIINLRKGESGRDLIAEVARNIGKEDLDWTNPADIYMLAATVETAIGMGKKVTTDFPYHKFSSKTFNIIRDLVSLGIAGISLWNTDPDYSNMYWAYADTALLWLIVRPIVDAGMLVVSRSAQAISDAFRGREREFPTMGDEPKPSFYQQFFGRFPEWMEGNVRFLKEEWWKRKPWYRGYAFLRGIDTSKPTLTPGGKRTITNILRMAYIPPLFGIYLLQKTIGSMGGYLVPYSTTLSNILFGAVVLGGIITLGKLLGPIVSRKATLREPGFWPFVKATTEGLVELVAGTMMLMPMMYYTPAFHLRGLRSIRRHKLESTVPDRTPGWLIREWWTVHSLAESYRVQLPTVTIGAAAGIGLGLFNPFASLISAPIWGSFLLSPLIAYYTQEPLPK